MLSAPGCRGGRRLLLLSVALAAGCESGPRPIRFDTSGRGLETADGLRRVRDTRVGAAWVKPGASFAGYDAVLLDPVTISYKSEPQEPTNFNRTRGNFALDPASRERLVRIFQESFERELSRSQQFHVVSEPGPNVLRVSGHIVNLVVNAPPQRGGEQNFVVRAGEMTLILDVRDARTGDPLARVADRRAIQPGSATLGDGFRSGPVANWGAFRDISTGWARVLREGLDDLHALPAVPLPDEDASPGPARSADPAPRRQP